MASWQLPADHPDETAEWAHTFATDYLQRRGCDTTCQALGALLSTDLVRHAITNLGGRVELQIGHVGTEVELRVRAARIGAVAGDDDTLDLLRRLASSWGHDNNDPQPSTWCRFACLEGGTPMCAHDTA